MLLLHMDGLNTGTPKVKRYISGEEERIPNMIMTQIHISHDVCAHFLSL